jgi:transposase
VTGRWELNDEQWGVVEPVLRPVRRADNRGRPWHDTRAVLNGVLWVLRTGAQWREMPEKYPPYQTCHARLVGDKAYDSDPLDRTLREEYGIEMIVPNRRNRNRSQDGRRLRRYRRRWKVERLFAWMHNFRRVVTRWEYHVENFLGFVHLACLHMLLKHL